MSNKIQKDKDNIYAIIQIGDILQKLELSR